MEPVSKQVEKSPIKGWILFLLTIVVVFVLGLLASSIVERRSEATVIANKGADVMTNEPRSELWGEAFPRQYEGWKNTADMNFKSKHHGSGLEDALAASPELVVLWAGYGFSKDYNSPRGHMHAVKDIRNTLRTGAPMESGSGPMPATCWTCKSPDVPRLMNEVGVAEFYKGKWFDKGDQIVNPIGCADCHDETNMKLKITRPALVEAFERQGKDITKASHQEMRSLVCAQCHVEYYFKGKDKYLTFPWDNGTSAEDMEAYFDAAEFKDWTHKLSRAPMLKAQHPGYELFNKGIHGQRGVSCADCHMPYKTEGAVKFTDHQIRSPLANVNNSCQVCHRESEKTLLGNVFERQDKILETRAILEKLLAKCHIEAKFAWDKGATEEQMAKSLTLIRHAQWRWDYSVASHGASFHAPLEVSRIMAGSLNKAHEARREIAKVLSELGYKGDVPMPDLSTKEKAQSYIGLPVEKLRQEKEEFKKKVLPVWDAAAEEREKTYSK